eukprot:TRINITY_DN3415_c0_g1_i1.p1 TRINITY_DN3415_c0_g1~~TRINITY_DN3415_c0_g1_i1.p1  ORF type:complete len:133 (-),score=37.15 TRINITY_DN3415_c0_g1_i1:25-423(-)
MVQIVHTDGAPKALGPYSQAVLAGNGFVFLSGSIGADPKTGELADGGVAAQAKRSMDNIQAILKKSGASFETVVKVTIFLKSMSDYAQVNEVYASYFKNGKFPARSCFQVAELPKSALVEIECIALTKKSKL